MAAEPSTGRGDVGGAGPAVRADDEVAQGGHDRGAVAGADLGEVLGEGDVADLVQPVLDAPVRADGVGELARAGRLAGQISDRIDRFGAPRPGGSSLAIAGDLDGQRGAGEADSGRDRGHLDGAGLDPPVGLPVVPSATGTSVQGSPDSWPTRVGWFALTVSR